MQLGYPLGLIASTGAFALVAMLPEADMLAWGWRVPFLLSAGLVAVGLFVRLRLAETPVFRQMETKGGGPARIPLMEVLTRHPGRFAIALGLKVSEVAWVSVLTVFCIAYVVGQLHLPGRVIINGIFLAAIVELFSMPLAGWLSDKVGRRPIYIAGTLFSIAFAFPLFWLLNTRDPTIIGLTVAGAVTFGQGIMFCLHASFMPELFGTRMRYSGMSLGFQVGAAISGGFTPMIAAALVAWAGGATWGVSVYLIVLAVVSLVAVLAAPETSHETL